MTQSVAFQALGAHSVQLTNVFGKRLWSVVWHRCRTIAISLAIALATVLQRLPVSQRAELAKPLLSHAEDANDHNLPLMIWYGLIPMGDAAPAALARLAGECRLPLTRKFIARRLGEDIEKNPAPLNDLLKLTVTKPEAFQADILTGLAEALRGWRKAQKPSAWDALQTKLATTPTACPATAPTSRRSNPSGKATAKGGSGSSGGGRRLPQWPEVIDPQGWNFTQDIEGKLAQKITLARRDGVNLEAGPLVGRHCCGNDGSAARSRNPGERIAGLTQGKDRAQEGDVLHPTPFEDEVDVFVRVVRQHSAIEAHEVRVR